MFDVIEGKILVFSVFEAPPSRPFKNINADCYNQFLMFKTLHIVLICDYNHVFSFLLFKLYFLLSISTLMITVSNSADIAKVPRLTSLKTAAPQSLLKLFAL